MSETKTYTAAQVEQMLAEQKARLEARKASKKALPFSVTKETRLRVKDKTPYTSIWFSGDFRPFPVSINVASAIVANIEAVKAALEAEPADKTKAEPEVQEAASPLTSGGQPRLAPQQ